MYDASLITSFEVSPQESSTDPGKCLGRQERFSIIQITRVCSVSTKLGERAHPHFVLTDDPS